MKMDLKKITRMGVLSALSIVLMLVVKFPIIPAAPYLIYEPADVPILICSFLFGPIEGLITTVVVALIQAVLPGGSGWVGFVMHVIATGTLVTVAGLIYRKFHTLKGAIAALVVGTVSMALIMIPANLFFTVRFWGMPYDTVVSMLLPVFVPFNLIKASANSVITLLLYKSLGKVLKIKISGKSDEKSLT